MVGQYDAMWNFLREPNKRWTQELLGQAQTDFRKTAGRKPQVRPCLEVLSLKHISTNRNHGGLEQNKASFSWKGTSRLLRHRTFLRRRLCEVECVTLILPEGFNAFKPTRIEATFMSDYMPTIKISGF